jgi:serine/threonine protein kinase
MNDAVVSTYRKLADLKAAGKHYDVQTPVAKGVFDASFCPQEEAGQFLSRLDGLIAAGDIIKDESATTISRASWQGHDLVIKRYNNQGVVHSLRHTLKGSRAGHVWLYGHFLNYLGITTPPPFAYVEIYNHHLLSSSYIVTPYINAVSLHRFIRDKNTSNAGLREVLIKITGFLDIMARHRITHGDLKHSNILVADSSPVLTDLDSLRVHRLDITRRLWRQRDIDRFMRSATMDDLPQATRDICKDVFNQLTGPATIAGNYKTARIGQWSMTIRKELSPDNVISVFCGDSGIYSGDERTRYVSSSDSARVFTSELPCLGESRPVYVKHFLPRSGLDLVKHLFRRSRATRAFEASLLLRRNGFNSPEPLALLEKGYGPFCTVNVLITDLVTEAVQPTDYLKKCREHPSPAATMEKRRLIRQLGHVVGRMHAKGISHGDLRLDNVLLQPGDDKWKFYFIDNERTRQFSRIPERLRLKNLIQLNMTGHGITRTDRMRFILAYSQEVDWFSGQMKGMVSKISGLTMRRLHIRERHHADGKSFS